MVGPTNGNLWGCLKCQVTWYGQRVCWLCGTEDLYIVGAGHLSLGPMTGAVEYYSTDTRPL
jgi:hypothetical protein